jgi:hypothetical protein
MVASKRISLSTKKVIMEPRYLYTIRWTQPYATYQMRPYLRQLRHEYERVIEHKLALGHFDDAKQVLAKIMSL